MTLRSLLRDPRWGVLTVNDVGVVELRVVGVARVEFVVFDVPTLVLIKHSKDHTPLVIRTKLHVSAKPKDKCIIFLISEQKLLKIPYLHVFFCFNCLTHKLNKRVLILSYNSKYYGLN